MEILLLLFFLAILPAAIAQKKGESAFVWWLFGVLLFPIALLASVILKDKTKQEATGSVNASKRCPRCDEQIRIAAQVCRFCGAEQVR